MRAGLGCLRRACTKRGSCGARLCFIDADNMIAFQLIGVPSSRRVRDVRVANTQLATWMTAGQFRHSSVRIVLGTVRDELHAAILRSEPRIAP